MLRKLFKYDFKAIGRIMLPLYIVTAVVGLVSAVSARPFWIELNQPSFSWFVLILFVVYFLLFSGTCIMSIVMSILRFKENILGREGYLTNTLPVSTDKIIISKTLSAGLWQIITGVYACVLMILTILILYGNPEINWMPIFRELGEALSKLDFNDYILILKFGLQLIGTIILGIVSIFSSNLMFYASLAIGHTANNKKIVASFGMFLAFYVASQMINLFVVTFLWSGIINLGNSGNAFASYNKMILHATLLQTAYMLVYYFITRYFISKKLNLE